MSDSHDARLWKSYTEENLQMARMALEAGLHNPSLQNAQQATEKALKAIRALRGMSLVRTHRIGELVRDNLAAQIDVGLSDDDTDLMDSIFTSSKYPPESALPLATPGTAICRRCLQIAERTLDTARQLIAKN